jgi:hypothetical protein
MARFARISPDPQLPLALEPDRGPQPETALRGVFQRMQISRRLTFEQAMSDTALAICIRNLARGSARRGRTEHSAS